MVRNFDLHRFGLVGTVLSCLLVVLMTLTELHVRSWKRVATFYMETAGYADGFNDFGLLYLLCIFDTCPKTQECFYLESKAIK